jgi:hypothetical protein
VVQALLGYVSQHFSRQSSCDRLWNFTSIALAFRPRAVFTGLQRRLHLEKPANGFPDLGYLSYAEFQRFLVVPEY